MSIRALVVGGLGALALATVAAGDTYYAAVDGTSSGTSWAEAGTLTTVLSQAQAGDAVWLKAGTYAPFDPVNAVQVIGGFAGTETSASESDPVANPTIIDGGGTVRVMNSNGHGPSTVLRGLYITNGFDDDLTGAGGLYLTNSSPLIVQCVFEANGADWSAGAVSVNGASSPQFVNCTFKDNGADAASGVETLGAGAVFVDSGTATFANCLFTGNRAGDGGAMLVRSGTVTILDSTFANNVATIGCGGAMYNGTGSVSIKNSIIWGNTAQHGGDQLMVYTGYTIDVTYSDVQGGWAGTGNIDADPLFDAEFKLQSGSPCRDVGQFPDLPSDVADLDWDGNTTEKLPLDLAMDQRRRFRLDVGAYEALLDPGGGQQ